MPTAATFPNIRPTLLLDFANAGRLSPLVTFTRASNATYFDETGILRTAANNTPRFDYNPATLAAQGLLIEEQRTNNLTYSEKFDNAAWIKGLVTISADVAVAPDGATTADKLIEDTSNGQHHVRQGPITVASGATVTVSVFAKAAERTTMQMYMNDNATTANRVQADFDLSAGTSSAGSNFGTFTGATSSITDVGNGWYRCVLTGVATGVTSVAERVAIGTTTYTGDGTSGLYIWGAQLEVGAFPTSYIPTTTTALTRSADVASVNTLSPWFNATEGTILVEASPQASNVVAFNLVDFNNATTANRISLFKIATSGNASVFVNDTGTAQCNINSAAWTATGKLAGAYKVDDFATSYNGATPATDTAGTVPSVTRVQIGIRADGGNQLTGHIRRITYYPRRLSNAELQAITS